MQTRKLRLLRLKYHVTLAELSRASGLSKQRISEIELDSAWHEQETERKLSDAFARVVEQRRRDAQRLDRDFQRHRNTLLHHVEDTVYEL